MLRSKRIIMAAATAVVSTSSFWQFKAQGATFTWDGGGANDSIGTAANWATDVAPATAGTDDWVFAGTTRLTPQNDYGPPRFALGATSAFNVFFAANAGAFNIGGSTLTMGNANPAGGNITNNSAFTQTFSSCVSPRTGTIAANTADIVFNGSFSMGNTPNLQGGRGSTIAGAHDVFFNAPIFNGGFLVVGGTASTSFTGTTWLTADNATPSVNAVAWGGTILVNTGNLRITNGNALGTTAQGTSIGSAALTGALQIDGTAGNLTVGEPITIQGRTVSNPSVQNIAGNNTLTNVIVTTGGTTANFASSAGKLNIGTINGTTLSAQRFWTLQGNGDGEIDGVSLGAATTVTLLKSGNGTWTLGNGIGANFIGPATISGGTLAVIPSSGDVGEIGNSATGVVTITQGATLDASGFGTYSMQAGQKIVSGGTLKTGTFARFGDNTVAPGTEGGAGTFNIAGNFFLTNQFAVAGNGLKYDLANVATVGGGVNDLISVTGDLTLDSANGQIPIIVNPLNGALATGTYRLINYAGNLTGSATDFAITGATSGTTRQTFNIDTNTAHQVNLVVGGAPANLIWQGDGGGNAWDVVGTQDWKNGAANDFFYNFDLITFNDSSANTTVNVNTTVIPGAITANTAQTYLITGGGTISGGATLTKSGTGTFIIANSGSNDFTGAITVNTGTLQVGNGGADGNLGTGSITNNAALVINKNVAPTVNNTIGGAGSIIIRGGGGAVLTASNTYSGATTVESGRLTVGNASALGAATTGTTVSATGAEVAVFSPITVNEPLTLNGTGLDANGGALHGGGSVVSTWAGPITLASDSVVKVDGGAGLNLTNTVTGTGVNLTLAADASGTGTASNAVSIGTGSIIKTGTGTWVLAGTNTFSGGTQLAAGTLTFNVIDSLGSGPIVFNGGAIRYGTGVTTDLSQRSLVLTQSAIIDTNGNSVTFTNAIPNSGASGLTKGGAGILTLAAANGYTGPTTIAGGLLQATDGVGLPTASNLVLAGGQLDTSVNFTRAVGTDAGQVQAPALTAGGFSANGADVSITLTNGGNPISWGSAAFNPTALLLNKAGSTNTITLNADFSMDTGGTFSVNGGTAVINSNFSGASSITFNGNGQFILTGGANSTYTGAVQIGNTAGTQTPAPAVRIISPNVFGTGTIGIAPQGNGSTGRLELANNVNVANGITMFGRNNNTVSIENVSGNNTLSGLISIQVGGSNYWIQSDAGTLTLSGASAAAGGVALTSGATGIRTVTLQGAANGNISGAINNGSATTLNVTKAGSGLWVLSGAATYAGLTTVRNGTLELGTNAQSPVLANTPGGADVQGGRLVFDYVTGSDPIDTINGLLTTSFNSTGSFTNNTNRIYSSTSTGTLGLGITDDRVSKVTVGYTVFGDANLDNRVNALDFNAVATNYGKTTGAYWYQGDFNYDGAVNTTDFTVMSQNFNMLTPTPTAGDLPSAPVLGSLVPEPASMAVLMLGLGLATRRRRTQRD